MWAHSISRHWCYEMVPLVCKIYCSTQKYTFTNTYVRSLLELSISFLHCCVNILTIDSLNKSTNLFVSPIFCDSQIWSSPARSRTKRIRNTNSWSQCYLAQVAYCRHFWLDGSEIVLEFYTNILRLLCVHDYLKLILNSFIFVTDPETADCKFVKYIYNYLFFICM